MENELRELVSNEAREYEVTILLTLNFEHDEEFVDSLKSALEETEDYLFALGANPKHFDIQASAINGAGEVIERMPK